ncbi:MAG: hypothetical protein FJX47_00925 [Alphaproteobacteria bacterium]|nr:hypothetical protein [Alphaproteobacteria bacterium]
MTKDELIRIAASIGVALIVLPFALRGSRRATWLMPISILIAVIAVISSLIFFGYWDQRD